MASLSPSNNKIDPVKDRRPPAVIHVDLDGATDIFKMHGWSFSDPADPIFETGMRNCLDFFEQNHIRATLFVIANSLDNPRKRALLQEAVQRGHEIASHTLTHPDMFALSRSEKSLEIFESRAKLESGLAVTVRGFRAPGYRIDRETCELLDEAGYEYDASAFPGNTFAKRLQCPVDRLKTAHCLLSGKRLLELPLPDYRPLPFPFNPSYALVIGDWYFRWGVRNLRRRETPLVVLFHLIDLAEPVPPAYLNGWKSRLFTLSTMTTGKKRSRVQNMIDFVRRNYRLTTTSDLLEEYRGLKTQDSENDPDVRTLVRLAREQS